MGMENNKPPEIESDSGLHSRFVNRFIPGICTPWQSDCLQYNALDVKKIVLTFGLDQSIFISFKA